MKEIIKKTEKERQAEITKEIIKVSDTDYYYWACDDCNVAYFGDDEIIRTSDNIKRCPNKVSVFKKICMNRMYGGSEETFNEYYKVRE